MSKLFTVADLFCGAGGEGTGIQQAATASGRTLDMLAVNHWDLAIETHSRNHPGARHLCETIQSVDPVKAVPSRRLNLLWASPECTHHSNARGGRPRSDQSRASAWLILKWLQELYVEHVIIENVPEFLNWGPIDAHGRAMPKRRGETFSAFVQALRSLGYRVDWRVITAADLGTPTTRKRFFLQARRAKGAIHWPETTHIQHADNLFGLKPWRTAAECIDWTVPGKSIFGRKKPLVDATIGRIECGIRKYWGPWAEPFLVILRGTGTVKPLNIPMPAITAGGQHLGLVSPFLTRFHGGAGSNSRNHGINEPVPTLDCSNRFGLVKPFLTISRGQSKIRGIDQPTPTISCSGAHLGVVEPFAMTIDQRSSKNATSPLSDPLSTIVTKARHAVVPPFLIQYYGNGQFRPVTAPLGTITCKDRFALIDGDVIALDILFRMLLPHELAAAQGFPADYWFSGNRSDQVRQIGNAVPCPVARALTECVMRSAA